MLVPLSVPVLPVPFAPGLAPPMFGQFGSSVEPLSDGVAGVAGLRCHRAGRAAVVRARRGGGAAIRGVTVAELDTSGVDDCANAPWVVTTAAAPPRPSSDSVAAPMRTRRSMCSLMDLGVSVCWLSRRRLTNHGVRE